MWETNDPPDKGDNRWWGEAGWLRPPTLGEEIGENHFYFQWRERDKIIGKELVAATNKEAQKEAEDIWLNEYEGLERGYET